MSRLNLKAETPTEERLLKYLEANASDSLVERINAGKKTMHGAWSYITDWAMKEFKPTPQNPSAGTDDAEVFGRLIHYFEEDSLDFEKKAPVAEAKAAPVKAKGRRTKVAVASVPVDAAKVSSTVDELLADCGIAVAEEKPAEPEPQPKQEPEAPPAPEERKEPEQMDWLKEFGISV